MSCQYQTFEGNQRICALGYYGGKPYVGNCSYCEGRGENTPEFAAALFAREDVSHPSTKPKLSGCCDRADQS